MRREHLIFLAFIAPNFFLFAVFTYYPILYSIALSFSGWNFLDPQIRFVGIENYLRLVQDGDFWRVLGNTLLYAVSVVLIAQGLAFLLALFLNRRMPAQPFFRTVAFTPHLTMTAAAALVWVLLLDPMQGPLSALYHAIGVEGIRFLTSSALALWAVIIVGIWKEVGFASIFFWAGLQGIDRDIYDAARVDGASPFAILRQITLPLMTPVIFFLMVSGFIQAMKTFDIVAVMTEGGPVYPASATYVYHLYKLAFRDFQAGYASALAVVFFVLIFGVTLLQIKLSQRWLYRGENSAQI
ncbi:MAG: sugar ABC transporter permease [Chloroflexota bacterium]